MKLTALDVNNTMHASGYLGVNLLYIKQKFQQRTPWTALLKDFIIYRTCNRAAACSCRQAASQAEQAM